MSKTALAVTEQDTTGNIYTLVLDRQPTASVTVTVGGYSGTDVTPSPASLTFTTTNWERDPDGDVTAVDDADATTDTLTLTHNATSMDRNYDGITIAGVTVTVTDNDTANLLVNAPTLTVAEESSGTFTVKLGHASQRERNRIGLLLRHESRDGIPRKPDLHDDQLERDPDGDGKRVERLGHRPGDRNGDAERVGRRLRRQDGLGERHRYGQRYRQLGADLHGGLQHVAGLQRDAERRDGSDGV